MTLSTDSKAPQTPAGPCCVPDCNEPRYITPRGAPKPRCSTHHRQQLQQYDQARRARPVSEERACARCGESFTWKSEHPKQVTCSKGCYMALRYERFGNGTDAERRNELARLRQNRALAVRYGLTVEEFERRRLGACEICLRADQWPLHLDHDHATGQLRGFLCEGCNHGLGKFRDNSAFLLAAIEYLQR